MIKPEVGMGATEICYSDRHPYTIIEVTNDKHIVVQEDNYKRIDSNGMSEMQEYEYYANPHGKTHKLRLNKHEQWVETDNPNAFAIGYRREYYDFSF
jgi:hypothetical protein